MTLRRPPCTHALTTMYYPGDLEAATIIFKVGQWRTIDEIRENPAALTSSLVDLMLEVEHGLRANDVLFLDRAFPSKERHNNWMERSGRFSSRSSNSASRKTPPLAKPTDSLITLMSSIMPVSRPIVLKSMNANASLCGITWNTTRRTPPMIAIFVRWIRSVTMRIYETTKTESAVTA